MSDKIPVNDILTLFEKMRDEHWKYEWGGARTGVVDCSGAFVYAAKKLGGISLKSHSSNYIPRHYIKEMFPISEAKPGYAVFRHTSKFETEALARKYNDGLGNFKHMGLISRDAEHVLEAKGTKYGFVETELTSSWYCCGPLTFVDYSSYKEEIPMETITRTMMQVNVKEGSFLNVRSGKGVNTSRLGKLYRGDKVVTLGQEGNWTKIEYNNAVGYVYSQYLEPVSDATDIPVPDTITEVKMIEPQMIITDEEGNVFRPVGNVTVSFEIEVDE